MRVVAQVPGKLTLHDIASDGRVLLTRDDSRTRVYFVADEKSEPRDLTWLDWAMVPILSPDGRTLVMNENDVATQGTDAVYLRGTDGSPAARLGSGLALSLSPDGRWVAVTDNRTGRAKINLLPVKAGSAIPLDIGPLVLTRVVLPSAPRVAWFPDSAKILFSAREPGHGERAFVQEIRGGKPHPVTPEGIRGTLLATDGATLLACDSRGNALLFPLRGGKPKPLPSLTSEYRALNFSGDGGALYAVKTTERRPRVWRIDIRSGRAEAWREIPVNDLAGVEFLSSIQITPDGKSIAYGLSRTLSELYLAHGLR